MKIALVGLGKMGSQMAVRFIEHKHEVIGFDAEPSILQIAEQAGIHTVHSRDEIINWFGTEPVIVWLMIPAGVVTAELEEWFKTLPEGSIVVDGGNSDYRQTQSHAEAALAHNIHFVDVGTSGGIMGLEAGFSLMIGGNSDIVKTLEPIFLSLAQPHGAYQHLGPSGAGHYIKMVHNAIEYGMMESLAEGYHLLHDGPFKDLDLAGIAQIWQHGSVIDSKLNSLIAVALHENPKLDGVDGYVAESGEARWALEVAKDHNVPMPAVQSSLDVRVASEAGETNFATKVLAELRNKFGGHTINKK
jgi:6-phosphogluconate dehydrogenase